MIHWGIIGAGNIAHRFAESLEQVDEASLLAVANRTQAKADHFAQQYDVPFAFAEYQAVLDLPQIDCVYIALPHAYHFEWIQKAIMAGKAVLCEKPAVLYATQLATVIATLDKHPVFFMEAMKNRFVPAYQAMIDLVQQGAVGEIQYISTSLRRAMPPETTSYHYLPEQGGCLLDIGIYNIAFMTDFVTEQPTIQRLKATTHENGIETLVEAQLRANGIDLSLEVGFDQFKPAEAIIRGQLGTITMPDFHRPTTFTLTRLDGTTQHYEFPYEVDDFYSEISEVMTCLQTKQLESSRMTWTDSLRCAEWIDLLKATINE